MKCLRIVCLVGLAVAVAGPLVRAVAAGNDPAWAAPAVMAVKRVSNVPAAQHRPNFLSNFDCTALTYRLVGTSTMQTGCFTPTAFGLFDSDTHTVIFNGTDEGLPLLPYWPSNVLAPWPKALNLVVLDAAATGGSYIGLYNNPLTALQDKRDWTGRLSGKQLTKPQDMQLKDPAGRALVINAQTLAGADSGSWLVAETLSGSFIRINLASLDQVAFAPAFGAQGSPGALLQSQVAISDDGRYAAIANDAAGSLKVYDLTGCGGPRCPAHDYQPFLKQQISGLQKIRHIRFINDGLLSFEAITSSGQDGVYELAPADRITSLTDYLGLGDSYTSGEGAFNYLSGTDTTDNTCHLSANSYPLLLTRDLFTPTGGHSVACSGAVINDVGAGGGAYRGQVKNGYSLDELQHSQTALLDSVMTNFLPGYVAQQQFAAHWQPRLMTVSVGGNDIGFGDILQKCVTPHLSRYLSDETCYNTYEGRQEVVDLVNRTVPRWSALYRQLQAEAPASTIYAVGYPSIASDLGQCPLNVELGKSELEFAEELIHYLNGAIAQAAAQAGVPYVDISQALAGYRLCEAGGSAVAVNGLTAGNDFGWLGIGLIGRESYHPNALGHQLIEQTILRQTHNLAVGTPAQSGSPPSTGTLLDVPRSGRAINTLVPDDTLVPAVLSAGGRAPVRADGLRDGLRAGSSYSVHLDGPSGPVLTTLTGDTTGNLAGIITVPGDTPAGGHTIDITGVGQTGQPLDITEPVYVPGDLPPVLAAAAVAGQPDASGRLAAASASVNNVVAAVKPAVTPAASPGRAKPRVLGTAAGQGGRAEARLPQRLPAAPDKPLSAGPPAAGRSLAPLLILTVTLALSILCYTIIVMRKFGVVVFSFVLFVSLLVLAFSTGSNLTFTHPKKIENWLGNSGLYTSFVDTAIQQANSTAGNDQSGGVSLSDTAVKQAAEAAFTPQFIQQNVNSFLDSNYAWLEGKTAKPGFKIDLTTAKNDFGQRVGQYVATYLSTLPACTPAQAAQINVATVDPLTLQCRPGGIDPSSEGALVAQQIESNGNFLSNPTLTADTFDANNLNNQTQTKPYYQRLNSLPTAYQIGTKIPLVAGVLTVLSGIAVFFLAARKRAGIKIVGVILAVAGLILVITKFVSDQLFNLLERHIFNPASVGQLQKSLTAFLNHLESQLVKIDLEFGIAYLLLAIAIIATLIITRQRGLRIPKPLQALTPSSGRPASAETPQTPAPQPKSPRPRPPRLVQ